MRATPTRYRQPARSFHGSEIRACLMPFAAMRSMKSWYMAGGSKPKVLTRPAIRRSGVFLMRCATSLMRSHGSSRSSRTAFLICEPDEQLDRLEPGSIEPLGDRQHHAGRHALGPQALVAVADRGVDEMDVVHVASGAARILVRTRWHHAALVRPAG